MANKKERLDVLLLERGYCTTRSKGHAMVLAGEVLVDGEPAPRPGMKIPVDSIIKIKTRAKYVSRGGEKLTEALNQFTINIEARVCADIGACTGGFTDVLLKRGASRVYAIDVGYGQLHWNLRNDSRVIVMERTNARYLESLPEIIDFICVDVSFISLRLILPKARALIHVDGEIVALIKPQFEAGPAKVGKGGVIKDTSVHQQVLEDLLTWCLDNNLFPAGLISSPLKGASGNREFLVWLTPTEKGSKFDAALAIENCLA